MSGLRNWVKTVLAIGVVILSAIAFLNASPAAKVRQVTPQELSAILKAKDFYLVNVHIPYAGVISGTDAFIPYDQTASLIAKYPKDKNAALVVYCRSGHMSAIAAKELVRLGYTNVLDLEGGMIAWEQAGLPLLGK